MEKNTILDYDIGLGKMQRYGPPPPYTRPTISEDGIPNREKTHGRNVIWFNPPFNLYCSTNVGQIFRRLIETHFTKNDIVSKLFNKNKVKLSYSCLPNIKAKISAHNKKILSAQALNRVPFQGGAEKNCNCQASKVCPLAENCVHSDVIYEAEILREGQAQGQGHFYIGLASGLIKKRISNHEHSFRNPKRRNDTELAKFIWSLKDKGIGNFTINWKILARESLYNKNTRKCQLCTREKVEIKRKIKHVENRCINKREECFTKCVHRWKHYLRNLSGHTSITDQKLERDIEQFREIFENQIRHNCISQTEEEFNHETSPENQNIQSNRTDSDHTTNKVPGTLRNGKAWKDKEGVG